MANRSYLLAVSQPTIFPMLRKVKDVEVIACKDWGIPILWFALFHPDEWEQWDPPDGDGEPYMFRTPITARKRIVGRLEEAAARLEKAIPKVKTWNSHLNLLQQAVDRLDPRYKYITAEFQEIMSVGSRDLLKSLEWLVRFFAGVRVAKPAQAISEISGLKLNRPLLDPATKTDNDFTERDWEALNALLGYEWKKRVPWTPRRGKITHDPYKLRSLIEANKIDNVKAELAAGTKPTQWDVMYAAKQSAAMLKVVLDAGGDPNAPLDASTSALVDAFHSKTEVVEKVNLLLDAGADPGRGKRKYEKFYVLYNCLSHGMKLAPRVIERTNEKVLKSFLANDPEGEIQKDRIRWGDEFLALVRKRLRTLQKKKGLAPAKC